MSRDFDRLILVFALVCLALLVMALMHGPDFPPLSAPLNWNTSR